MRGPALSSSLTMRPTSRGAPSSPGSPSGSNAQKHAVAQSRGRAGAPPVFRGTRSRSSGTGPRSAPSQSDGRASRSPSRSRAGDVGDQHGGQGAGRLPRLAAATQRALVLHFPQHALQGDPVVALDAEGSRDLALADLARALPGGGRGCSRGDQGQDRRPCSVAPRAGFSSSSPSARSSVALPVITLNSHDGRGIEQRAPIRSHGRRSARDARHRQDERGRTASAMPLRPGERPWS